MHSAQWRHDLSLAGKRVVCIGTGASALQFLPHIAAQASSLVITQRTAPWLAPTPDYHEEVPVGLTWLYTHVPSYSEFNRFAIFWRMGDGALEGVRVDPTWESDGGSVSMVSEFGRQMLVEYFKAEFGDRPDLLSKVVPNYPVGAKRMVRDNGVWARTLKLPHVQLVTDPIARITATGIEMADGTVHEADVLVYGTGYEASKFLTPMQVTGRDGVDLHEQWHGDARAYLGVAIPGFPTSSACTARTPTSSSTAASSTSASAGCATSSTWWRRCSPTVRGPSRCAATCTTNSTNAATRRTGRWRGAGATSAAGTRTTSGASHRTGRSRCWSIGSAPSRYSSTSSCCPERALPRQR
jgi:cation diffusion facilitator CzcD-associated flavoprotein CzcO